MATSIEILAPEKFDGLIQKGVVEKDGAEILRSASRLWGRPFSRATSAGMGGS
jgi:hypothetical protein